MLPRFVPAKTDKILCHLRIAAEMQMDIAAKGLANPTPVLGDRLAAPILDLIDPFDLLRRSHLGIMELMTADDCTGRAEQTIAAQLNVPVTESFAP